MKSTDYREKYVYHVWEYLQKEINKTDFKIIVYIYICVCVCVCVYLVAHEQLLFNHRH